MATYRRVYKFIKQQFYQVISTINHNFKINTTTPAMYQNNELHKLNAFTTLNNAYLCNIIIANVEKLTRPEICAIKMRAILIMLRKAAL